jgi:hypothetical protein
MIGGGASLSIFLAFIAEEDFPDKVPDKKDSASYNQRPVESVKWSVKIIKHIVLQGRVRD